MSPKALDKDVPPLKKQPRIPLGPPVEQHVENKANPEVLFPRSRATCRGGLPPLRKHPACPALAGRGMVQSLQSYRSGLIAHDTARQRQCPAGQIAAVVQEVELNVYRKITIHRRSNLSVRCRAGTQPTNRLKHRRSGSSRPSHDAGTRVPEPDGSSVDLERSGVAVRHVADLRGHCVGEAQLIRGHQPSGMIRTPSRRASAAMAASSSTGAGRFNTLLILGMSYRPWLTRRSRPRLGETRQGLINGLAAAEVHEVLRCAHPPSAIVDGHPLHDIIGDSRHWITSLAVGRGPHFCQKSTLLNLRCQG